MFRNCLRHSHSMSAQPHTFTAEQIFREGSILLAPEGQKTGPGCGGEDGRRVETKPRWHLLSTWAPELEVWRQSLGSIHLEDNGFEEICGLGLWWATPPNPCRSLHSQATAAPLHQVGLGRAAFGMTMWADVHEVGQGMEEQERTIRVLGKLPGSSTN